MLFQVPGQDVTVPIPGPGNAPSQDDVADAGGGVLEFLAGYPALVGAIIVAVILYRMWQNVGMRILMIAAAAVIVTIVILGG